MGSMINVQFKDAQGQQGTHLYEIRHSEKVAKPERQWKRDGDPKMIKEKGTRYIIYKR